MPRTIPSCSLMWNFTQSALCKCGWLCIPNKLITRGAAGSTTSAAHGHLRPQGGILPRGSSLPPSSLGARPGDHRFSDQLRVEHILRTRASPSLNQQELKFLPRRSNMKLLLHRCQEKGVPAVP